MNINWTSIIIALIFGIAMWFVPNPLVEKDCPEPSPQAVTHIIDTVEVLKPYPVYSGQVKPDTIIIPLIDEPFLIAKTTEDSLEDGTTFKFTSETLLEARGDTLTAQTTHKWDIQPRPLEQLVITDSVKVPEPYPVEVPARVPFYEKPAIVAPVTAIITAILVKYLIK